MRRALDLTNWDAGQATVREWEVTGRVTRAIPTVADAVEKFLASPPRRGVRLLSPEARAPQLKANAERPLQLVRLPVLRAGTAMRCAEVVSRQEGTPHGALPRVRLHEVQNEFVKAKNAWKGGTRPQRKSPI